MSPSKGGSSMKKSSHQSANSIIVTYVALLLILGSIWMGFVVLGGGNREEELDEVLIHRDLEEVLEKSLLEKVGNRTEEEKVEVMIRLEPMHTDDRFGDSIRDKPLEESLKGLQRHSREKQTDVIEFLENEDGEVINSFWIANAVLSEVKVSTLDRLVELPEISKIHENREIDLERDDGGLNYSEGIEGNPKSTTSSDDLTWGLDRINVTDAWEGGDIWKEGHDGSGVRVAVSDTGMDIDHPDLEGKMVNVDDDEYYTGGWIELDEDGEIVENSTPSDTDEDGHGTHVSGTIAGENESGENIGVAPGVDLMHAVTFPGGDEATEAQMLAALEWKAEPYDRHGNKLEPVDEHQANIASMSWAVSGHDSRFVEPIRNLIKAGVVPVAAIGNDGEGTVESPGAIYEAFGIGALEEDEEIAEFSSGDIVEDGREDTPEEYVKPDFSAPGVNIKSAVPDDGWENWSGTSMAVPHVAGTIALMLDANPTLDVDDIYEVLSFTSDYYEDGETLLDEEEKNTRYGRGIIDAGKAVDTVSGISLKEADEIGKRNATLKGEVFDLPDGEIEVFFRYRKLEEENWQETSPEEISEPGEFHAEIDGLNENTVYEYKAVAQTDDGEESTFTLEFKTEIDLSISTLSPDNVTQTKVILRGEITDMPFEEGQVFFRYRKIGDEWSETSKELITEPAVYEVELDQIERIERYEYKAVGEFDGEEFTGDVRDFKTVPLEPEYDDEKGAYLITDVYELQWMKNDLQERYLLQGDIEASETEDWYTGAGFKPIGDNDFSRFNGSLEGQDHSINNLTINRSSEDNVGLFGTIDNDTEVDSSGEIKNITLNDLEVVGRENVGGIIGRNLGKIENIHVTGKVHGHENVGGLIGNNSVNEQQTTKILKDSSAEVEISGGIGVGGIIGVNFGEILRSYSAGEVTGTNESVGGLIGINKGQVYDSYSNADVKGDVKVGGLIGLNEEASIDRSYSTGEIIGETDIGGLVGLNERGDIRDSFWDKDTSGLYESDGGTGKTLEEMLSKQTFIEAGWDFEKSWGIIEDETYPFLQWQEEGSYPFAFVSLWLENPLGQGDVILDGELVDPNEWPYEKEFEMGTEIELEGKAHQGWTFRGWSGDVPGEFDDVSKIVFELDQERTIRAEFVELFELSVNISEGVGEIKIEDETYGQNVLPKTTEHAYGSQISIEAFEKEGWRFYRWIGTDPEVDDEKSLEITIEGDLNISAIFLPIFEIEILSIEEGQVFEKNKEMIVEYGLYNPGEKEENRDIIFQVYEEEGVQVYRDEKENVTLGSQEYVEDEFNWIINNTGELEIEISSQYDGEVENTSSITVTIEEEDETTDGLWLLFIALVILACAGVLIFFEKKIMNKSEDNKIDDLDKKRSPDFDWSEEIDKAVREEDKTIESVEEGPEGLSSKDKRDEI